MKDWVFKSNGPGRIRLFKCFCDKCGIDRGYKRKRESNRLCRHCTGITKYKYNNIDFDDFILHTSGTYRLYRTRCIECNKDKGYHRQCFATKKCHSCAMKDKWSNGVMSNVQKGARHSYEYSNGDKKLMLRSSYELAYAKWLDIKGIKWEYEPHFKLSNGANFFPDFRLEDGTIVEIKGYFREDAKIKWQMFEKEYPNINKQLLMKSELKEMGVL